MAKYQVLKTKVTVNAGALKVVKPPSIDFKIEVEINNKIFNEAKLDPLLRMKFADQAKDILVQTQKTVFDKCKVFDKLLQGMLDYKSCPKEFGWPEPSFAAGLFAIIAAEMGLLLLCNSRNSLSHYQIVCNNCWKYQKNRMQIKTHFVSICRRLRHYGLMLMLY
jgi:Zn finger protein HypA/HybF involved in hydrogenase expression